jgi:hypothetical protein
MGSGPETVAASSVCDFLRITRDVKLFVLEKIAKK